MLTITDIANTLNVDRAVAYGLVHFMEVKGYLKPTTTKKLPHQKGKPASLYSIGDDELALMVGDLATSLAAAQEAQAALEASEAAALAAKATETVTVTVTVQTEAPAPTETELQEQVDSALLTNSTDTVDSVAV